MAIEVNRRYLPGTGLNIVVATRPPLNSAIALTSIENDRSD
ncbi:MAG: hypothetical protein ACJ8M1_02630 [Chthoniobacterales bacterium]